MGTIVFTYVHGYRIMRDLKVMYCNVLRSDHMKTLDPDVKVISSSLSFTSP